MENEPQFSAIMQAFGQSFLQPDIHLFKQNLFYLETLNTKQKLYHKVSALLSWKDPSSCRSSEPSLSPLSLLGEYFGEHTKPGVAPRILVSLLSHAPAPLLAEDLPDHYAVPVCERAAPGPGS